ncbi:hypothetical protein E1B28_005692 [Marasmius oreades]|uniref:Uncharacterized protein n=1 Tax=Marasmius oreades TaxID=181124 RepID=A0A9P7S4C1_9AGAR|nr:uncharacterized protein E1B28_005692 [Marasmius oreades]KAG7094885.1 hypothetical protein E1B28_005692 [Marasmius oreades]
MVFPTVVVFSKSCAAIGLTSSMSPEVLAERLIIAMSLSRIRLSISFFELFMSNVSDYLSGTRNVATALTNGRIAGRTTGNSPQQFWPTLLLGISGHCGQSCTSSVISPSLPSLPPSSADAECLSNAEEHSVSKPSSVPLLRDPGAYEGQGQLSLFGLFSFATTANPAKLKLCGRRLSGAYPRDAFRLLHPFVGRMQFSHAQIKNGYIYISYGIRIDR